MNISRGFFRYKITDGDFNIKKIRCKFNNSLTTKIKYLDLSIFLKRKNILSPILHNSKKDNTNICFIFKINKYDLQEIATLLATQNDVFANIPMNVPADIQYMWRINNAFEEHFIINYQKDIALKILKLSTSQYYNLLHPKLKKTFIDYILNLRTVSKFFKNILDPIIYGYVNNNLPMSFLEYLFRNEFIDVLDKDINNIKLYDVAILGKNMMNVFNDNVTTEGKIIHNKCNSFIIDGDIELYGSIRQHQRRNI